MDGSILTDIKKFLGIDEEYEHFDNDIVVNINTFIRILYRAGIGKKDFYITDKTALWSDFLGDDLVLFHDVKTYLYLRVRLIFDPPASSTVASSYKETIDELIWHLNVQADPGLKALDEENE